MRTRLPKAFIVCALITQSTGENDWALESFIRCDDRINTIDGFRQGCEALLNDFKDMSITWGHHGSTDTRIHLYKGSCSFWASYGVALVPMSQVAGLKEEVSLEIFERLIKCVRDGTSGGTASGWGRRAGYSASFSASLEDFKYTSKLNPYAMHSEDNERTALLGGSSGPGLSDPDNLHVHDDAERSTTPSLDYLLYSAPGDIENQLDSYVPPAGNLDQTTLEDLSPHDAVGLGSPSALETSTATADNSTCYATCYNLLNSCWNHDRAWTRMLQMITGVAIPVAIWHLSKPSMAHEMVQLCTEAVNQEVKFPGCP